MTFKYVIEIKTLRYFVPFSTPSGYMEL